VVLCVLALAVLASAQTVLDLTESSFDAAIADKKVLVEFFAPWCGHCKQLAPKYDAAAAELGTNGVLAKVDCTVEKELCSKYGIRGYPTLKFFNNGVSSDYEKGRTTKDIVNFILEQNRPAVTSLASVEEAEAFVLVAPAPVTVLGFFSEANSMFASVADAQRSNGFSFASSTNEAVAAHYKVTAPAVIILKQFDTPQVAYTGDLSAESLTAFLQAEAFPMVGTIGPDNYKTYVDRGLPLLYLFIDPKNTEHQSIVAAAKEVAPAYKGKISFVDIDGVQYGKHGESLGLKDTTPGVVLHDMDGKAKYVFDQAITVETLSAWLAAYSDKTLIPHMKTQPVPETQPGPVYTLVGANFDSVVRDVTKDALVEFYAPWCGHCKELKPKYDKVGAHFKDDANIVIGAVDSTENDVAGVEIEGFPTIMFFPASQDGKVNPIPYNGDRTDAAMIKFVSESRLSSAATAAAAKDEL